VEDGGPRSSTVAARVCPGCRDRATLVVEVVAVAAKDTVGRYGEDVAARHLAEQGLVILQRNWRCDIGEIDIVARDGSCLVVCEVKTRRTTSCGSPVEAVTPDKAARLRRLAARWLADSGLHPPEIRIDVVAVLRPPRGAALVEHLRAVT
jgi:putative endonuclease